MTELQAAKLPPRAVSGFTKFLRWLTFISIVVIIVIFWWQYYDVFGEGTQSGELRYIVKKGNVFKTYEGKLVQEGLRSKTSGSIESNTFDFSVENDSIANILMLNSGSEFILHYKEYRHAIPWRGYSAFIVDTIVSMKAVTR